jgi:hypothetical protein
MVSAAMVSAALRRGAGASSRPPSQPNLSCSRPCSPLKPTNVSLKKCLRPLDLDTVLREHPVLISVNTILKFAQNGPHHKPKRGRVQAPAMRWLLLYELQRETRGGVSSEVGPDR